MDIMQIAEIILHSLKHTLSECIVIIPFMFLAYLLIGALERGGGRVMIRAIVGAGKTGPLFGGLLGLAPSCGFSAAAANLYGAGILTAGTLISVFLSTSDEMLAVMISERADITVILRILLSKLLSAVISGFILDFSIRYYYKKKYGDEESEMPNDDGEITEDEIESYDCGCNDSFCATKGNLFVSALIRTLRVFAFIFVVSFLLNILFEIFDISSIIRYISDIPVVGSLIAALIGLIPNCAVSVAVTELYLGGVVGAPFMFTALLSGAGSGLAILFRSNQNVLENFLVCGELYVFSVIFGTLFGVILF